MPLSESRIAVGRVGELLRQRLTARTSVTAVDVGRPQAAAGNGEKLNLFLYRISVDGHMRNLPLDTGQEPPLWLVLHYLVTAYDTGSHSDSLDAHDLLSEAMIALEELNFLRPGDDYPALVDNPEPLKISFDESDPDLLSKLMQGGEDHYRLSVAFQVRPVMVASTRPPSYAPLVKTVGPDDEGVGVIPGMGPVLESIEPLSVEAGEVIELRGRELGGEVEWICLGDTCLGATSATGDRMRTRIPEDTSLSAGSYAITAMRESPGGRRLYSNAVLGRLRPTLDTAVVSGALDDDGHGHLSGTLELTGRLLGGEDDSIFVAFYLDGEVMRVLEVIRESEDDEPVDQTQLEVTVSPDQALPPGRYRIILRVNGEQSQRSPEVDWS